MLDPGALASPEEKRQFRLKNKLVKVTVCFANLTQAEQVSGDSRCLQNPNGHSMLRWTSGIRGLLCGRTILCGQARAQSQGGYEAECSQDLHRHHPEVSTDAMHSLLLAGTIVYIHCLYWQVL